jgi:putative DNA primase/helicase
VSLRSENCRGDIAKALGWRIGALDDSRAKRVKARMQDGALDDGLPGQPLTFDEIKPWPEPIDGAALLDELAKTTRAYVDINRHQCDATALWAVFAHAHDLRDFAPLRLRYASAASARLMARSPSVRRAACIVQ